MLNATYQLSFAWWGLDWRTWGGPILDQSLSWRLYKGGGRARGLLRLHC